MPTPRRRAPRAVDAELALLRAGPRPENGWWLAPMLDRLVLAKAIWALGLTQIIGYGTLYYSFSILAPSMAQEFGLSEGWAFGALSASLFAGSLFAPTAGRWADRFGAGRIMTAGSV